MGLRDACFAPDGEMLAVVHDQIVPILPQTASGTGDRFFRRIEMVSCFLDRLHCMQYMAAEIDANFNVNASDAAAVLRYAAAVGTGQEFVDIKDFV